ncbi:MAG: ferrochelatase [Thermoplasmataceae archaeon]
MENKERIAIIMASYGSPESKEDLMEYLRDVFNGRDPPEFAVKDTEKKYATVDFISPSGKIIKNIRDGVEKNLQGGSPMGNVIIVNAFKHWKPSLMETVKTLDDQGIREIKVLPLFPLRASSIYDSYIVPLLDFMRQNNINMKVDLISGICTDKNFVKIWADSISKIFRKGDFLLFTAHSLPKLKSEEQQYIEDFEESAREIAKALNTKDFATGFQSQGMYGRNWLGPSIYEVLEDVKDDKLKKIITVPIGFLYDHLEILYDLDLLFAKKVRDYGLEYARAASPNASESFIKLLGSLIERSVNQEQGDF